MKHATAEACRSRTSAILAILALAVACHSSPPHVTVPTPDVTDMEQQVKARLAETRAAVLESPRSAETWGRFGMVAHAHELWGEAAAAYLQAEALDPTDPRWPYYLGDVLSVVGTDLDAAVDAFRRAMELKPAYAPAHMRLGRTLIAAGRDQEAAVELEAAIVLEPDLQPAQVSLAQIRLSQGKLEEAVERLEAVLATSPRHEQALASLGQAYMRQGRRAEARAIALRARDAAIFNLYSDPIMSQVVSEGVSSVLIWDRAKGFLDNGNYEQAARGLRRVVALKPDNSEAHHQLAVALGNLGQVQQSRHHLERALALAPELVEAHIQLAVVLLEQQDPHGAVGHLESALELAPGDPDVPWLLGRALLMAGDLPRAVETFEAAGAAGAATPSWAHTEWGKALAQTGRATAAFEHFRSALASDPGNAEALFYSGLLMEGLNRVEEAVSYYCRSMRSKPNPPTADRLRALARSCP